MKKIILLALTALLMVGCNYTPTEYTTRDGKQVVFIDSCEYIEYSNGYGALYCHKGNCRFCEERDSIKWEKRKKELKELVEQLKEK